jgi:3-oxoacyl-(acyl-carrier-protein) synthase
LGHSIGGSGAIELVSSILSLHRQLVPPTINYQHQDPDCDLDYVISGARAMKLKTIMSNSFAFGGSNAVLLVRRKDS